MNLGLMQTTRAGNAPNSGLGCQSSTYKILLLAERTIARFASNEYKL